MPLRNSKKGTLRIHNQHGITYYVLKNCTKELLLREGNDASDSVLCFVKIFKRYCTLLSLINRNKCFKVSRRLFLIQN